MGNQNCFGVSNNHGKKEQQVICEFQPGQEQMEEKENSSQNNNTNVFQEKFTASRDIFKQKNHSSQINLVDCQQQEAQNLKESSKNDFFPKGLSFESKKIKHQDFSFVNVDPTSFMKIKQTPIELQYEIMQLLCKSQQGDIYRAKYIVMNQMRAIKKISKMKIGQEEKINLIKQFQFMQRLDHPHIIKLYDIFEDTYSYYVATELCEGGSLLDVLNSQNLSDDVIRQIMFQLLGAVNYMHRFNILHRDIKLENIVVMKKIFDLKKDIPDIKIIDFGLAIDLSKIVKDDTGSYASIQFVGTMLYMPPQVFQGFFNVKWDIWSCGVVLYMLLTKKLPYKFKSDSELKKCIMKHRIQQKYLTHIQKQLKEFLMQFFEPDRVKRISAAKLLENKWFSSIKNHRISKQTCSIAAKNLVQYSRSNNLITIIQSYLISKRINQQKRQKLAQIFGQIDKDNRGIIEISQLKKFIKQSNLNQSQQQIEYALKMIDKDGSGTIGFNEFIAIMHNRKQLFTNQSLEQAFEYYDLDRSGDISKDELIMMLKGVEAKQIEYLFNNIDKNGDKKISKGQWIDYLIKQSEM